MTPTKATVIFLKDKDGKICLAQKKKPIHHDAGEITYSLGTWNGYGGKKEDKDITIEDTALRELEQESGVTAKSEDLINCGHVFFFWPNNESEIADMEVFFYFANNWNGEVKEGDEMGPPKFFAPNEIPYENMMGGDKILLPKMLSGEIVNGKLYLGKKDTEGNALFVPQKT
jgi:8-oxo-dGTP pyrophosphatase MutT (NUDIX family)